MFNIEEGSSIAAYVAATEKTININSLEEVLLMFTIVYSFSYLHLHKSRNKFNFCPSLEK